MSWAYFIGDLNGEEVVRMLYKKELHKTNQTELRMGKVIAKKEARLSVKWSGYNN